MKESARRHGFGARSQWAPPVVARLRALNDGRSMSEAAAVLNREFGLSLSRNAVIGKVSRLGVDWMTSPASKSLILKGAPPKKRRAGRQGKPSSVRVEAARGDGAGVTRLRGRAAFNPLAGFPGVALMDLGAGACRWPVRENKNRIADLFCGAPRAVGAALCYCPAHMAASKGAGTVMERGAEAAMKSVIRKERSVF